MNIWKKALLSFFALFIAFSSIVPSISLAQETGPWYAPTLNQFTEKVQNAPESEIFGERYTQAQIYWILYSLVNFAIGQGVTGCSKDPAQAITCIQNLFSGTNIIPGTGNVINDPGIVFPLATLVDSTIRFRPASGVAYVAEKLERLNVVDSAYAQSGFGYDTLSPTIPLWTAMRNASYALMVVVIVVLAFMIMLRTKISPQASLTVQIAIPRIVMALVLITFSFAIAGLLIDLAYLALGLLGALFSLGGVSTLNAAEMFGAFQHWGNGMVSIGVLIVLFLLVPSAIMTFFSAPVALVGVIAAIIILILVLIIYLLALFKILWLMFRSMLMITLLIVFSPIYILWGVISSSSGFGTWVKSFVGHLSVFVTIPLLIFFANVIMWGSVGPTSGTFIDPSTWLFLNPFGVETELLAGGVELPGFFGGYNFLFGMIGALVLLLSASKLSSSIRDYIITGRAQFGLTDAKSALGPVYGGALLAGGAVSGGVQAYGKTRVIGALTKYFGGQSNVEPTIQRGRDLASRGVSGGQQSRITTIRPSSGNVDPYDPRNYTRFKK